LQPIAHYDFGLSREEIRTVAVIAAAVAIALLLIEYFGKKLRKPNSSRACEAAEAVTDNRARGFGPAPYASPGRSEEFPSQCVHCDTQRSRESTYTAERYLPRLAPVAYGGFLFETPPARRPDSPMRWRRSAEHTSPQLLDSPVGFLESERAIRSAPAVASS
jgi:hypothetical protein